MKKSLFIITGSVLLFSSCGKKTNETKPVRMDITETVFASGTLEPEGKYNLTAQTEGYITELKFDNGDTVKAEQVLAMIDNRTNSINAEGAEGLLRIAGVNASLNGPTLKQAEQNSDLLREKYLQDSLQQQRYSRLLQSGSVSKLEYENVQLAFNSSKTNYLNALQNLRLMKQQTEQQLILQKTQAGVSSVNSDYNSIKAVVKGKVYRRLKEVGDYIRRGDVIAVIGSEAELFAKLSVDESNISKIKVGQEVLVQLNTGKEKNYSGTVSEILPYFDEPAQSFYCKVKFKDEPVLKISGTQLQANIIIGTKNKALVIPKTFLGYGSMVNVKGKGLVKVSTGFISGEWVEIKDGLTEENTILADQLK
jgi:multidrug efflux pump subunit AcrA (membrane-fusion protein)